MDVQLVLYCPLENTDSWLFIFTNQSESYCFGPAAAIKCHFSTAKKSDSTANCGRHLNIPSRLSGFYSFFTHIHPQVCACCASCTNCIVEQFLNCIESTETPGLKDLSVMSQILDLMGSVIHLSTVLEALWCDKVTGMLWNPCVYHWQCASFLSRVVLCGDKRHLADGGGYRLLPDLHLDGGAVLRKRRIHVTHGNVHFQARGGAATGHLTYRKQQQHNQGCSKHLKFCFVLRCTAISMQL